MPSKYDEYLCFHDLVDNRAGMGRANERVGRIQETYVANATTSWLESLERSLAQMKEYQVGLPQPIRSAAY